MDAIEARIRLPAGAFPISAYARLYAYAPDGGVSAIYVIPSERNAAACANELALEAKDKLEVISFYCQPPKGISAGERRWVSNHRSLPIVDDGGCHFVDVRYDPATQKIDLVECHGAV